MDLFIPSSYKPGKKNSPKWFNSQRAKAVNNKNHYFKEWKRLQTQHSRTFFIQSRNTCSKTIKNAKSSFVQRINSKIASCQAGSCSFWSMAKVVSQNSCQSSFPPLKNNSDSSSTTPSSKANLFASIFASNSNLDDQGVQPHHFPPSKFTMSPIKFSTRKVCQTLLQLDTYKSKSPDGIPAIVLKTCAPELAPILNKLFQLSNTLGTFHTSWKQAHVFPIPKKGDKSNPLNYRPIPITSIISRTMETIVTKQLLTFLETNNLLSDHQYGFRKARSTSDLLDYAVHVWSSALECSGESRVISLDISKAFDRVWYKSLLAKLPMFGLHHTLINWIGSFLSDRSIAVRVDGFLSNLHSINAGVPQGSVISPVLFILFINDLLTSTSSSTHSFADDTFLSSSFSFNSNDHASTDIPLHRNISASLLSNNYLTVIEKWGKDNLVSFNQSKTKQAVISRKRNQNFPAVFMNGNKLDTPASFTQLGLGLSLSSNLTWKTHIHSLAKYASQKLGFLARARGFFSSSHLLSIYKSQIRLSLEYCSPTSGVVLQNLLSVFSTKSSPKPFVSSIILTSRNRSNLFPIVV